MNDERGFSLLELLVVLGIIAIATAIIYPVLSSMKPMLRLDGAVSQMQGDLMRARMQAISRNEKFGINFASTTLYKLFSDDDDDDALTAGAETTNATTKNIQTNYYDVTYTSTNANLVFTPRGNASVATTLTLQNPNPSFGSAGEPQFKSKTISINRSGRIKVVD